MRSFILRESTIQTIIFDFDGTLAKLNIDFFQMRESVLKLISFYGISKNDLPTDYILEMIDSAKEVLWRHSPDAAQSLYEKAHAVIEEIETTAAKDGELFGETRELLNTLPSLAISCGIITRNCSKAVKIVFPDISSYCPVVVSRDDVTRVKPHPEHLNAALSKLGAAGKNALMIGDHPLDIQTGRNAGTKTCGVLTGRCKKDDFVEAGADLILAKAADILNIIN